MRSLVCLVGLFGVLQSVVAYGTCSAVIGAPNLLVKAIIAVVD
jgi:hypothetical protein